ncbi:hypothetical protein ACLB2K_006377 [Fragaria x ananassa]
MLTFYFDDTFVIEQLDPDGKKFDKVSRIVARSEKHGALLHLDVNTEIYPMGVKEKFLMVLSPTLNYSGAPNTNEAQVEQKSLADKFEYIMYGLLYKMDHMRSESSDGGSKSPPLVEVYVSFGGLQMRLRADPNSCGKFKDQLREELEMDPELPAVLLMGGGEGMGPVKETARVLGESFFDKELGKPIGQLIVICGRNKNLVATLESDEWNIPVKIRGFETQMEKWMGSCDCIITKAGPGTIAEALIRGLPIILNDYIPGQEKGNVPCVVDNGAGVFTRSLKETARIVAEWFSTKPDELKRMSENALKLAQPEAVFDNVKDIHDLACQRGPLANIPYILTSSFTSIN